MSGLKLLDAMIFEEKLAPSTKYGTLFPSNLSQTTSIKPAPFMTLTLTTAQASISNFPSATSCNPGEPFFWLRLKGWKLRPSAGPEYNFNFTPPIRSQTNADLMVMFLKAALNCLQRHHRGTTHRLVQASKDLTSGLTTAKETRYGWRNAHKASDSTHGD